MDRGPRHVGALQLGDALPLGRYAATQYLQYAIATVKDRALPRVADGLGITIVSTPQGVMADHEARERNVGGEVLCKVF